VALRKCVNGKYFDLTPEEEAATLAEWEANRLPIYTRLVADISLEGTRRLKIIFPALNNIDEIEFAAEQWKSIAPAARKSTPEFQKGIDIYTAAKQAISVVESFTTQIEVDDYDVQIDPGWPA